MLSPVAPGVEMVTISIDGILVEQCPASGGHWLDNGELAKLAKAAPDVEDRTEPSPETTRDTSRLCPRDSTPLVEVHFSAHQGLRLDTCPMCGGIWLDARELSQALTLLGRPGEAISPEPGGAAGHVVPTRPVLALIARLVGRRSGS
jgi:Zn-finger nucleic acid-binding protein